MKIYVVTKKEVNIGDVITINNIEVEVTQKVIERNPSIFKIQEDEIKYVKCTALIHNNSYPKVGEILPVTNGYVHGVCREGSHTFKTCFVSATKKEYEEYNLVEEAKKKYKIGDLVRCAVAPRVNPYKVKSYEYDKGNIANGNDCWLFYNGVWATLEKEIWHLDYNDNPIYNNENFWWVNKRSYDYGVWAWDDIKKTPDKKYLDIDWYLFDTKEAAIKYIKGQKIFKFKSDDGEDITIGDEFYLVNSSLKRLWTNSSTNEVFSCSINTPIKPDEGFLRFKYKDNAIKWIENRK